MIARRAAAFLLRDFRIRRSYRLAFLLDISAILFTVALFYFLGGYVGPALEGRAELHGRGYFGFVLVGIALYHYMGTLLAAFSQAVREGQTEGTLEALLTTPLGAVELAFYPGLYALVRALLHGAAYFLCAWLLFGLGLGGADLPAALLVLFLATLAFAGLGVLSAGFVMIFKRGDPVVFFLTSLSGLFGGVYFPAAALPERLELLSNLIPLTFALKALRSALFSGAGIIELKREILVLFLFAALFLAAGTLFWRFALGLARKEGTLGQY